MFFKYIFLNSDSHNGSHKRTEENLQQSYSAHSYSNMMSFESNYTENYQWYVQICSFFTELHNIVAGHIGGAIGKFPDCTWPVSYTHLDVYKRQQ